MYGYGVFPYCFMLEILTDLVFEGCSDVGLKVAITVFLIGSKYFDSKGPRVDYLLLWARNRISKDEVIECEAAICQGFDYELPDLTNITLKETTDLCSELEAEIFNHPC